MGTHVVIQDSAYHRWTSILRPGERHGLYASCLARSVSSLKRPIDYPALRFKAAAAVWARCKITRTSEKGRKIPAVQHPLLPDNLGLTHFD